MWEVVDTEIVDAPTAKSPVCGCMNRLREAMRGHNGAPGVHRRTGAAMVYIRKLEHQAEPAPMMKASFCPICGEAYT